MAESSYSSCALDLEISKTRQYMRLAREGIPVPKTVALVGARALSDALSAFARGPLIIKPNRSGKGLGVRLYETPEQIVSAAERGELPDTVDGTLLVLGVGSLVAILFARSLAGALRQVDTGATQLRASEHQYRQMSKTTRPSNCLSIR